MLNCLKFFTKPIILIFVFALLTFSPVFAASASFSTSGGGKITTGQTITVTVSSNGSEAYNAVSVNVNFNNLTYMSASASGNWTPVSGPSRSGNTISFSGGKLGGSYTGSRAVLTLTFRAPNTPGTATISSSGTIALANGSGTQVSGGGNTATYTVAAPPAPTPTPLPPKPAPDLVSINSSSHAVPTQWYTTKDAILNWNKQSEVDAFSYILDQNPATTADDTSEGADITKTYPGLTTGTYYFHIKAHNSVGWGNTAHFQINIDDIKPDPFSITKVKNTTNGNINIYFATNDTVSGVAKYTAVVDGKDIGEQKSGFAIGADTKAIRIIATDRAGNTQEAITDVKEVTVTELPNNTVTPIPSQDTTNQNNNSANLWVIITGILASILFAYGVIITVLYWKRLAPMTNDKSINRHSELDSESPK